MQEFEIRVYIPISVADYQSIFNSFLISFDDLVFSLESANVCTKLREHHFDFLKYLNANKKKKRESDRARERN